MATFLDLATDALIELGVLGAGEVPTADDSALALRVGNRMVDMWKAERLQIHTIARTVFTIASGTGTYTVGSGGTVNVARPVYLDHVNLIDTSPTPDLETPLSPLTDDAYAGWPNKALTGSAYPTAWYYDQTYPLGNLILLPTPTSTTLQGVLYAPAAVAQFASINTAVALPPAYEEMLVTNLAVRLAPSFEREASPNLIRAAMSAKAIVKASNSRIRDLSFDAFTGNAGWDIHTGP